MVASAAAGDGSGSSGNPFTAIEAAIIADNGSGNFASEVPSIEGDFAAAESQLNLSAIGNSALLAEYQFLWAQSGTTATESMLLRRAMVDKSIWNLENPPAVVNDIGTSVALADGLVAGGGAWPVPEPSALVLAALGLTSAWSVPRM